jgi:hypothetical protein
MKKKLFLIILTIMLVILTVFNLYKLKFYKNFTSYLGTRYPENSFKLGWVKYDFIYGDTFSSKVLCREDGTEFTISDTKGNISEHYVQFLSNNRYKNSIIQYFKSEEILNSISSISPSGDSSIAVAFQDQQFSDDKSFAEASHEVISVLKKNNVQFKSIVFWHGTAAKISEIRLAGTDINGSVKDIMDKIMVIKGGK